MGKQNLNRSAVMKDLVCYLKTVRWSVASSISELQYADLAAVFLCQYALAAASSICEWTVKTECFFCHSSLHRSCLAIESSLLKDLQSGLTVTVFLLTGAWRSRADRSVLL